MRKSDILSMCLQNLFRRKARTFLTVLGVVVGSCSIIIMISIGAGMKESQQKMLSEMGDLTIITVMPLNRGSRSPKINDQSIRDFRAVEGVVFVTPKITADGMTVRIAAGRDKRFVADYVSVAGMQTDAPEKIGYHLISGEFIGPQKPGVMLGEQFAYSFRDTKRPSGRDMIDIYSAYRDDGTMGPLPKPFFDPMKTPLELVFEVQVGDKTQTFTYKLKPVGIMKSDYGKGEETQNGVLMSVGDLSKLLNDARKASGDKRYKKGEYQTALVKVKDIQSVASAEEEIKRMGYMTTSMESIRKPMEREAAKQQMMLGGLGAISLFVAALGITNTMIMSISERTREIGVMKALGCYVHDVRAIFLMEAGFIGLLGGIVGIIISAAVSGGMNLLQSKIPINSFADAVMVLTTPGSRTSVIPLWLPPFSLVFSILIGLGSGFYPANKAVRISALEAIKHD